MPESEFFWEQILDYVESGSVIPVVGQDLLQVEVNGGARTLYVYLARELAGQLEIARREGLAARASS